MIDSMGDGVMTQRRIAGTRRTTRRPQRLLGGARQLAMEGLEQRQLLAGNVTAAIRGTTLVLTGDAAVNNIAIVATDNNRYAVIGIDTDVNRSEDPFVTTRAVRNILVSLGGGNDVLLATNDAAAVSDLLNDSFEFDLADRDIDVEALQDAIDDVDPAEAFSVPGNLTIMSGQGGDVVGIAGLVGGNLVTQLSDFGSDAANYFVFDGLEPPEDEYSVGAGVVLTGGSQGDSVAITNARVKGRVTADLGNGANLMVVTASQVGTTLTYTGGTGSDTVATGDVEVGLSMAVVTRDGDDEVYTAIEAVGATKVGRFLSIDTGAGADIVAVTGEVGSSLSITTGDGDDEISVVETKVDASVTINSGSGNDTVEVTDLDVARIFQAYLGTGNDGLTGTNWKVGSSVQIDAGAGNDEVSLSEIEVERYFTVLLGSGDDSLMIEKSKAMSLYIVGGSGNDTAEIDDETRDAVDDFFAASIEENPQPT
ncbi:MAG: hypothetical protein ACKO38_15525 [Planctomycetota bacterium]